MFEWLKSKPKTPSIPPPARGDLFVVIDLETTGLDPRRHRIIEVGAIRVNPDSGKHSSFQAFVNPGVTVPREITELTGITQSDLEDGQPTGRTLAELRTFIGDLPLIAYNADFDMSFLEAEMDRTGEQLNDNKYQDVLALARERLDLPRYRLVDVARHFGIEHKNNHRAVDDCVTTLLIYDKLVAAS